MRDRKWNPTFLNCYKPEHVGTKEHGKMLQRIQILEQERKRRLSNEFEMGGFMAQKGLWNLARDKMLQDRGALPEEEGDVVREYKAMHEEHFLISWLREDVEGKKERRKKVDKETREEVNSKRKREGEKGGDETVAVKRSCTNHVSFPLRLS